MFTILTKMFCRIQNGRTLQKKHICMQNKLHAEQFSHFPMCCLKEIVEVTVILW